MQGLKLKMENIATIEKKWSAQEERIIHKFIRMVRDTFKKRVKRIVLYGSRARGDADDDSDYDFLVLLEPMYSDDKKTLSGLGEQMLSEHSAVVLSLAVKKDEFTEDRYYYLYENISKEGIVL